MKKSIMQIWFIWLTIIIMIAACDVNTLKLQGQLDIHDIQGCSHTSPYVGQHVNDVVGVVTHKVSYGFTMQSITPDELFCSSEGIFVYTKDYPAVMVADLVEVNGLVDEFTDGQAKDYNLTQTEIYQAEYKIIKSSQELPESVVINDLIGILPTTNIDNDRMKHFEPNEDGLDFYESLESMLVEISSGMVVSPRNEYGEIIVLPDVLIGHNLISQHGALLASQNDTNPEKVMIKLPVNYHDKINVGDWINSPIIGVMDYSYGNFKLVAYPPIEITSTDSEVESFVPLEGGLTLATYNLENLSLLDKDKKFEEIAKHIVKTLHSPDLLVLNEVMDDSGSVDDGVVRAEKNINKLITTIKKAGGPSYSFSDIPPVNNQDGGLEGGNIRTVLFYRTDKGIGLDESISSVNGLFFKNGNFLIDKNPLLIGEYSTTFAGSRKPRIWLLNQNNRQFFVVGVHLTSQAANSPDWGSQQPPLKPEEWQRVEEARLIYEKLIEIQSLKSDIPIIIAGDMNDLPWSKTIITLIGESFSNTANTNTPEDNYSYIFEGNAQALDYIFANKKLASSLLQARYIHINSYLDRSDAISDHDPVVVEFALD